MSNNKLYNYISNTNYTKPTLPQGVALTDKSDAANSLYLYNLPLPKPNTIGVYKIQEHHLTVNRLLSAASGLPASEYHYTAMLLDEHNVSYKLHVFYNHKNEVLGLPVLRLEEEDESISISNHSQLFLYAATTYAQPLIKLLLNARQQEITNLANQYETLEKEIEFLSQNALDNKSLMSEKYRQQIMTLEQLVEIAPGHNKYLSILSYLKKYTVKPEFFPGNELSQDLSEPLENKQPDTPKPETDKEQQKPNKKPTIHADTQEHFVVSDELELIHTHLEQYQQHLKVTGFDDQILKINQIHARILSLKDRLNFDALRITSRELKALRNDEERLGEFAQKVLLNLLFRAQFDKAAQLKDFYFLLPEDLSGICLMANNVNVPLLTFLLKNEICSVNQSPILVKGTTYNSMLEYCFSVSSIKNTLDIATVLINHGASLLACDDRHVLPYAALLLSQDAHPLSALLRTQTKALDHVDGFYKELKEMLVLIAQRPGLDAKYIAAANNTIKCVNNHREEIKDGERVFGKRGGLFFQSLPKTGTVEERVEADSEVKGKRALMKYNMEVLSKLVSKEQRESFRKAIMSKHQIPQNSSDETFEQMRARSIAAIDHLNANMKKMIDFYEIRRKLALPLKTFKPIERKRMQRELEQLSGEVHVIFNEYSMFEESLFGPKRNQSNIKALSMEPTILDFSQLQELKSDGTYIEFTIESKPGETVSIMSILEKMGVKFLPENPDDPKEPAANSLHP